MGMGNLFKEQLVSLIGYCDRHSDPSLIAERLTEELGAGAIFRSSSYEELAAVEGVSANTAMTIRLIVALLSRRITDSFSPGKRYSDFDIERFLVGKYLGRNVETVFLLSFDSRDRLLAVDLAGEGTPVSSDTYPRKLLELALKRGAHHTVISHNHPGGAALPSEQDISATARLYNVMQSGGVGLKAHYIVSDLDVFCIDPADETLFSGEMNSGQGV